MSANTTLTILAENYAFKTALAEDGISIFIESNNQVVLYDTGFTGNCLIYNAQKLNIDLNLIKSIIISHGHDDHSGGLIPLLNKIGPKDIFAHPSIFKTTYAIKEGLTSISTGVPFDLDDLSKLEAKFNPISSFTNIGPNFYLTGEVPFTNTIEQLPTHHKIKEIDGSFSQDTFRDDNSLVIDTEKGVIVICGCAHPGVVNILEYVKSQLGKPIYGVIGGFHLKSAKQEQINFVIDYLKKEQLKLISPGHCTGMDVIYRMKEIFGDIVKPAFSGTRIVL